MAETYGFYDTEELVDGSYDREYIAQQWADYFKLFIGTGVFASPTNQLKVVAGEGMNIVVKEGWAFIEGRWYHNDADLVIPVQPNTTASTITSGVFIQANSSDRVIRAVIATGRTTPDREAPYYELELAQIQLATGTTAITNNMITDMRTDESVCGFVKGLLEGVIPTADLFLQFETQFNTWFNHMKDQLSSDAAGHLQTEIDETNTAISAIRTQQAGYSTKIDALEDSLKDVDNDWYAFDFIPLLSTDGLDGRTYYSTTNDDHTASPEKFNAYKHFLEGKEELLIILSDSTNDDAINDEKKIHCAKNRKRVRCTLHDECSYNLKSAYLIYSIGISYNPYYEYESDGEENIHLYVERIILKDESGNGTALTNMDTRYIRVYRHKKYQSS